MRWAAFLSGVALISAILVVVVRHQNRLEFLQVRAEEDLRDELNDEWSRLQLEKATWARHNLVEEAARNELGMVTPG
ncbi:MAG: cell division protein FtsL, partial [Gammaproteobacteria bacterium]